MANPKEQKAKSIAPVLFRSLAFLVIIFGGIASWLFKDGLGPDSVTSIGYIAFSRFISSFWLFGVFGLLLFVASYAATDRGKPTKIGRA